MAPDTSICASHELGSTSLIDKMKRHRSQTPSKWRQSASARRENAQWLRYSQRIAMLMLDSMDQKRMTQREVAQAMGCSQQYVSRVLKGTENLSIETIAKIETVLGINIMSQLR